jgi:hypothetical protein
MKLINKGLQESSLVLYLGIGCLQPINFIFQTSNLCMRKGFEFLYQIIKQIYFIFKLFHEVLKDMLQISFQDNNISRFFIITLQEGSFIL